MMEGSYKEWEHVTVEDFLAQKGYRRESSEEPIAGEVTAFLSASPDLEAKVRGQHLSTLLDSPEYRAFLDAYTGKAIDVSVKEYLIGYAAGVRARNQPIQ